MRAYLSKAGYAVRESDRGADALNAVRGTSPPDLVLLDLGLPDIDGLEVLRTIRSRSDIPVIVVTARAEEVDTLVGLTVGADDYISKPFSPREVVARIATVLRRTQPAPTTADDTVLRFEGLMIDVDRREVMSAGAVRTLSALEFDLFLALARSPGRVFSRTQLLEKVWGYDFFGDERVVDVHVRNLRKILGDSAAEPAMIGTVRGVGYKFIAKPVDSNPETR